VITEHGQGHHREYFDEFVAVQIGKRQPSAGIGVTSPEERARRASDAPTPKVDEPPTGGWRRNSCDADGRQHAGIVLASLVRGADHDIVDARPVHITMANGQPGMAYGGRPSARMPESAAT
jgi:hypothetical protein